MIRSRGHCNTMGTASTMGLLAEALGMVLPGLAGTPAADSRLLEGAHDTGRLAVEMVAARRTPSSLLTRGSFLNAIVALAAIGGSTNAVVHLLAIAGRLGVELTQDDFDSTGSQVPLLVDLQPAGRFLMEDFFRAGGLHAVLQRGAGPARSRRAHGHRQTARRPSRRRARSGIARSSAPARSRCSRTPASPCCTATSPRTAR